MSTNYIHYPSVLVLQARLQEENILAKDEIKQIIKQIESEQGNLSQYTDRQAKAASQKAELEVVLSNTGKQLVAMQEARDGATAEKKQLESQNQAIKKDIEDLELAIQKLEQEKTNRDHILKTLNDEIADQDEVLNKLNKEKKHAALLWNFSA